MHRVDTPSANSVTDAVQMLSLNVEFVEIDHPTSQTHHTSFELITEEPEANSMDASTNSIWALHDTGATHHMFNDKTLFVTDSLKPVEDTN